LQRNRILIGVRKAQIAGAERDRLDAAGANGGIEAKTGRYD
jgi:hypothetical protein